jgi:hypothetical protein
MRVLCYVNHYFGTPVGFQGRSTDGDAGGRRSIVAACLDGLRALPGIEVNVCGIAGNALETIDIDFRQIRDDPKMLVYESLAHMAGRAGEYDYYINIEDDILLPIATFDNVVAFDAVSLLNEVLHPNRVETDETGRTFCVDTEVMPGWTYQRRTYRGHELRVARNPHSAVLILSRAKLDYALEHIDLTYRGRFLTYEMDSALAYYLSPFSLYRPYEDLAFHTVTHLDRWAGARAKKPAAVVPPKARPPRRRWKAVAKELIPPILLARRRKR